MKYGTGILKRWEQENQSQNLGESPIESQVEEDESKRSTSNVEFKPQCSLFIGRWGLDVGRFLVADRTRPIYSRNN